VFQIVLTENNKALEFVILSVFVAHFTNDLNKINPVYSMLNVCEKKVKRAKNKAFVSHTANQSNFSY